MSPEGVVADVDGLLDMFCRFHFLKFTKEVESLIVASLVTCLHQLAGCLGGPRRRGCYIYSQCCNTIYISHHIHKPVIH